MTARLIIVFLLAVLMTVFFVVGGPDYLTLSTLHTHKVTLLHFVDNHYGISIMLAMFIYILAVALSLPGATFLSLVMGFIFGRWLAWSLLLVSATIGAVIVFWLARYLFYDWAKAKLEKIAVTKKIMSEFEQHALNYLLFLRLVPLFPFWLVNLTMAFTTIKTSRYALGTFFGIMPGCFVFANLGQSLAEITSIEQLLSPSLLLAFILLGLLMLLPVIFNRRQQVLDKK